MGIEIDLFVRGGEIDFIHVSKLTWFSAGNAVGLVFVWVVEKLTWFSYAGRKSLGFSASSNWLAFCVGGRN